MNKPTLSNTYNYVFNKWIKDYPDTKPECECCEADLTNKDVVEGDLGWYCSNDCLNESENNGLISDADLRNYERKQLGIGS